MVSYTLNTSLIRRCGGRPNRGLTNRRACHYLRIGRTDNHHELKSAKAAIIGYERNSKTESQEYSKFLRDKKSLITILFGQCDEATQTEIALGDNYTEDRNEGRLLAFIE